MALQEVTSNPLELALEVKPVFHPSTWRSRFILKCCDSLKWEMIDPGAEMNLEMCWKWISFLCWGFSLKMRLLHLILRNDWLWGKGKKGKHLSYRLTFKLYCSVLARKTRLLTHQWSLRGWALHLFLSHTLYRWFSKRLLDSLQNSYPHSVLKRGVGELNQLLLDLG